MDCMQKIRIMIGLNWQQKYLHPRMSVLKRFYLKLVLYFSITRRFLLQHIKQRTLSATNSCIKDAILTNTSGIENRGNYFAASKERAFLDVLYLNKDYHFDNLSPLDFGKIQSLLAVYNNKRMDKQVKKYFKHYKSEME